MNKRAASGEERIQLAPGGLGAAPRMSENSLWLGLLTKSLSVFDGGRLQSSLFGAFNASNHGFVAEWERALVSPGAFNAEMVRSVQRARSRLE